MAPESSWEVPWEVPWVEENLRYRLYLAAQPYRLKHHKGLKHGALG